jgi:hypothetical protein
MEYNPGVSTYYACNRTKRDTYPEVVHQNQSGETVSDVRSLCVCLALGESLAKFVGQHLVLSLFLDVTQQKSHDGTKIFRRQPSIAQLRHDLWQQVVDWILASLAQLPKEKPSHVTDAPFRVSNAQRDFENLTTDLDHVIQNLVFVLVAVEESERTNRAAETHAITRLTR